MTKTKLESNTDLRCRSARAGDGDDGDSRPQRRGSGHHGFHSRASWPRPACRPSRIAIDDAHRRTPLGGPGRQPRAEAAGHGARAAADAVRPCRHRAHLRRFAPGAEGQADRRRPIKRPAWGPTTAPGAAVLLTTALAILRGKLPHPPLTLLVDRAGRSRPARRATAPSSACSASRSWRSISTAARRRRSRSARPAAIA